MASVGFQIDPRLAKIAPNGSITCLICQQPVKSAKVWTAHVNGRQHRSSVEALKQHKVQQQETLKRPAPESTHAAVESAHPTPVKKLKTNNNEYDFLKHKIKDFQLLLIRLLNVNS